MKEQATQPSPLARAFFHWFCHPDFREEIEGDLLESFHHALEKEGYSSANKQFIKEVFLLFRPSLMGNFKHLTNLNKMTVIKQQQRAILILVAIGFLLMIPMVAMNFSSEVNWSPFDFIVAGLLLGSAGLTLEFILRRAKDKRKRIYWILAAAIIFFLIWAELAVGIFGSPFAGT